jgi:S1-C subfamily serine protease
MKKPKIIQKYKKSIILLDVVIPKENNQKQVGIRGTGFFISSDGKFITAAHVYNQIPKDQLNYLGALVPSETDEKGSTKYKRYEKLELLEIDIENDVALMKIITDDIINIPSIKNFGASEKVREGDDLLFLGYPLALELITLGFGVTLAANGCMVSCIKRRGQDGSLHFFVVDTHINNGSSGSPVFLSKTGKVIGIVSGKISQKVDLPDNKKVDIPANIGICRPAKYIVDLIKKNDEKK